MAINNIIDKRAGSDIPINDKRISNSDITGWNIAKNKSDYMVMSVNEITPDVSGNVNVPYKPVLGSITTSTTWTDMQDGTYVQTISSITGVTNNTKIDLQPSATVLDQMITDTCKALYVTNNNSVLTLVAVGASISTSVTIQYTRVEVAQ